MHDPYLESYLSACLASQPKRRYSSGALLPVTLTLVRQYEAKAARNPAWLKPELLASMERSVVQLSGRLGSAKRAETKAVAARSLFYAIARRNAVQIVLGQTAPAQALPLVRLARQGKYPPGVAAKLAAWRYERKNKLRALDAAVTKYQKLRTQADEHQLFYDRLTAELTLAVEDADAITIERRMERGPQARAPRGSKAHIKSMRARQVRVRREAADLEAKMLRARHKVRVIRDRCELLRVRIRNKEIL